MIRNIKVLTLFISVVVLYSCSGTANINNKANNSISYRTIAKKRYKDNYKVIFNTDSTYVICQRKVKPTPSFPQQRINFFVYNVNQHQVIFEDDFPDGKVYWLNNHQIKIERYLGNIEISKNEKRAQTFIYDVIRKEILPVGDQSPK